MAYQRLYNTTLHIVESGKRHKCARRGFFFIVIFKLIEAQKSSSLFPWTMGSLLSKISGRSVNHFDELEHEVQAILQKWKPFGQNETSFKLIPNSPSLIICKALSQKWLSLLRKCIWFPLDLHGIAESQFYKSNFHFYTSGNSHLCTSFTL